MNVLAVNGSPNKRSKTEDMLNEVLSILARDCDCGTGFVNLRHYAIRPYDGYDSTPDQNIREILAQMRIADIIVFGTPVHWQQPSSIMKLFLDNMTWAEMRGMFEGKVAGVVIHCDNDGAFHVGSEFAGTLLHMGFMLPPFGVFFKNKNIRKTKQTSWQFKDVPLLANNLYELARLTYFSRHPVSDTESFRWNNE